MKKTIFFLSLFFTLACYAQPGSTKLEDMLQFAENVAMHPFGHFTKLGESNSESQGSVFQLGQVDSFYYWVESGNSPNWTEKTVIRADTILQIFQDLKSPAYYSQVYSGKSGKLLKTGNPYGHKDSEYYYSNDWKLDSMVNESGCFIYVTYDGNKEYRRFCVNDQLLVYHEFDEDGHIINTRDYRGRASDGTEWRESNFKWRNGRLVGIKIRNYKNGESTHIREFISFKRGKNGLVNRINSYEIYSGRRKRLRIGLGGPVIYRTKKDDKGQTTVTRTYKGHTNTYIFDNRGNWVSIIDKDIEQHRILFYKNK